MPWKNDVSPPPTNGSRTTTASKKAAKARVAMATHTPPSRSTGRESRAPIAAAIRAPTRAADQDGQVEAIHELEHGEPADRREGPLAERDLAGEAGDHGDRQQDGGQDHGLGDQEQPRGVGPGEHDDGGDAEEGDREGPGEPGESGAAGQRGQRRRRWVDP